MRKEGDKRKIKEMKDKRSNIPRVETKKRECWKFLDWRMNSENDSRVHGQPSFASLSFLLFGLPSWVIILFLSAIVFSLLNKDFIKHYKQDYHWRWEKWRCKKRTNQKKRNPRQLSYEGVTGVSSLFTSIFCLSSAVFSWKVSESLEDFYRSYIVNSHCLYYKRRTDKLLKKRENIRQAVSKDLTSSSKFSGSCVLTLQTLLRRNKR